MLCAGLRIISVRILNSVLYDTCSTNMATSMGVKMRSRSVALDDAPSTFVATMDDYIRNSSVLSKAIASTIQLAVNPLNVKVGCLERKTELAEIKSKANANEQYSRRNNVRIFGLPELEGEDCYQVLLAFCENDLKIPVTREEIDRAHRVDKVKMPQVGQDEPPPRPMIVKLAGYSTKMKFMRVRRNLGGKKMFVNEDLTKINHKFMMHIKEQCPEGVSVFTVDGAVRVRSSNGVFCVTKSEDLAKYRLTEVAGAVDGGKNSVEVVGPEP